MSTTTTTVECHCCNRLSTCVYRCEHCGKYLAGDTTTEGEQQ